MDDNHTLLLDIYHAARTLPADEIPAVVMAMLRAAIGFDFARLLCADIGGGAVVVHGSIMYNIPTDNALDWERIQQQDLVLPHVLAHPGRPVSFHCTTLFAAPAHAIMRDYVQRYEHRNGLAIMLPDADTGLVCIFHANWTPVPPQTGQSFQRKLDTRSRPNWTPVPG